MPYVPSPQPIRVDIDIEPVTYEFSGSAFPVAGFDPASYAYTVTAYDRGEARTLPGRSIGEALANLRAEIDAVSERIGATTDASFNRVTGRFYERQEIGLAPTIDTREMARYSSLVGNEPTRNEAERVPEMPRRLDPKPCACGCGEMTKSGEFLRGHHTRRRWELIKCVTNSADRTASTSIVGGLDTPASTAGEELARRGWAIPDTHRHFGVELEVICRNVGHIADVLIGLGISWSEGGYHERGARGQWMITRDSSVVPNDAQRRNGLAKGFELVTPPLRGKAGIAVLRRVMTALEAAGVAVNMKCGTHVHHEARDLSLDNFRKLVTNYTNVQGAIDRVLPPSRRTSSTNHYCQAFQAHELDRIGNARDVRALTYAADRYRVLNLNSFASYGTVEFRQHSGTVNAEKIVNWILFGQALIKASKKNRTIEPTTSLGELGLALELRPATTAFFQSRALELAAA